MDRDYKRLAVLPNIGNFQDQLTANPIIIVDDNLAQEYFMSNLSQILQ
jgi:hypothetical protein